MKLTSDICNTENSNWTLLNHTALVGQEGSSSRHRGDLVTGSAVREVATLVVVRVTGLLFLV